jgi:hypothetical protein
MPSVVHRDWKSALRRESDHGLHFPRTGDAGYQHGLQRQVEVITRALGSVPIVIGQEDRPGELGRELRGLLASDDGNTES